MVWLLIVLAVIVGLGAFLAWVVRQSPTRPRDDSFLGTLLGFPVDLVSTDRALRRAQGGDPPDDDDKIVV